jgi:GntR family transcriptional regulator, transcriptional repressor for pyruvate dehydrogenase complex
LSAQFEQIEVTPAYRKVAAAISARILARELLPGARLPAEAELARQFGVNRGTVREALRELESQGLVTRRAGSKLMTVSRPAPGAVARGIRHALTLHQVTFLEVWEALTILEPPIAQAAACARTAADLAELAASARRFAADSAVTAAAIGHVVQFFRCLGEATHNRVLLLAQEPLLTLLQPSLRDMIDKVPQARARIATAQAHILEAVSRGAAAEAGTWMARHIRDFRKGYELAGIDLELRVTAAE